MQDLINMHATTSNIHVTDATFHIGYVSSVDYITTYIVSSVHCQGPVEPQAPYQMDVEATLASQKGTQSLTSVTQGMR